MTGYQSKRAAAQDKMDSMEREALKLAQQVMESLPGFRADIDNALDAIKEALAQPEQKPVAFISPGGHIHYDPYLDSVPLYTAPPHRWPLTDDEVVEALGNVRESITGNVFLAFARAIEAAHGIKETEK